MRATLVPAYERKDGAVLVDHKLEWSEVKHGWQIQPDQEKKKKAITILGYINRGRGCLSTKVIIILKSVEEIGTLSLRFVSYQEELWQPEQVQKWGSRGEIQTESIRRILSTLQSLLWSDVCAPPH